MKFYSRELCEKLQKLGCVSESGFVWRFQQGGVLRDAAGGQLDIIGDEWELVYRYSKNVFDIPAFTNLDFLDTTEQAKNNIEKIFPDNGLCWHCGEIENHSYHEGHDISEPACYFQSRPEGARHAMLDSPDGEEYIARSLP